MIEKNYQPADIEGRMSLIWEDARAFKAGRPERRDAKPFTIVIPPPNVTGSLHMGHALNNTLQDVLCRFERMRGRDVLWQPGTDHAGIATQMVVERQLLERQQPGRREMGRKKFLERVWQWKEESGGTIVNQLKRLGASCDWSRERFTMDEGLSRAVVKVFVQLHREGLIYKDKRLVNWDPKLLTAISDLEVQQIEHRGSFKWSRDDGEPLNVPAFEKTLKRDPNGHLYYIDYPLLTQTAEGWIETGEFITVATTRPETMLGDVAVAVHPESDLWRRHRGKRARLPLVLNHPIHSNLIPIIADEYADPEKGTGAVKITPAHDFNDHDVWLRHSGKGQELEDVQAIGIFTPEATLKSSPREDFEGTKSARWPSDPPRARSQRESALDKALGGLSVADLIPERLRGKPRFEARKLVVEMLAQQSPSLLAMIEPHAHMVPHGDRSGVEIEPFLTDQWYADAKSLAGPAIEAVRSGRTKFVPENWERTYFEWMENIQPWCVSRQLWWGHRIPAWYGPEGVPFVAETEREAKAIAIAYYKHKGFHKPTLSLFDLDGADYAAGLQDGRYKLSEQDEDVLDTWFSSALWPFSTLGWPEDTPEVKRYYPTDVLVTGFDIIFFWVARMMMMGLHFMEDRAPFSTVYIHRLVRDEKGAKMSKSKGNVIDPLELIDKYGADALRFALAREAAQGHDIKLSTHFVETNRNVATKLWNACRFAEMNGCRLQASFDPREATATLNQWIARETARVITEVTEAIDAYRFNDAANLIYHFVYDVFCDWYLELAKPVLFSAESRIGSETRAMVAWTRDEILKLLHPFMPFITEELWSVTERRKSLLALSPWPTPREQLAPEEGDSMNVVIDTVSETRSIRQTYNIQPKEILSINLTTFGAANTSILQSSADSISRLANTVVHVNGLVVAIPKVNVSLTAPSADMSISSSTVSSNFGSPSVAAPSFVIQTPIRDGAMQIAMPGSFDISAESARLAKELDKADADIKRVDAKLGNEKFVANAPEEIVEEEKEKREAALARKAKILEALERLKNAS